MRRDHLRSYILALIAEKVLTLNPRDRLDVNVRRVLAVAEHDIKAVLKDIGQDLAANAARFGGAVATRVLGDLVEQFAANLSKK